MRTGLMKRSRALAGRIAVGAAAAVVMFGLPGGPVAAQSGGDVLRTALQRYEERMQGVDDYTVVQDVLGSEHTTYYEREEVDGHIVFRPVLTGLGGQGVRADTSAGARGVEQEEWSDPYRAFMEVADRAQLEGKESVGGQETFVVRVDDFSGTSLAGSVSPAQGNFRPRAGTFYIDDDDYLLRKMRMEGTQEMDGESHDVSIVATFTDYRDVEGVLHPFRMDFQAEGFQTGYSEEELENAREQMEELKAQMENMPEAQRKMMEGMLGPQLEKFQEMLATGSLSFTVTVKEIRVNEGPPEEG